MTTYFLNEQEKIINYIDEFRINCHEMLEISAATRFAVKDYDPKAITSFYDTILQTSNRASTTQTDEYKLSPRQQQILQYLAYGNSCKTIANKLGLSVKTVYYYLEIIKKKLQLFNKDALTKYYWDQS